MSSFGFDSTRHNPAATGFSQARNPFAGLSNRDDDGDALEFEDTYDGLGDQLDETDDVFNNDTFGDTSGLTSAPVGKDFDFFGQTAKVANAIEEEHVRFQRQQPASKVVQPAAQTFARIPTEAPVSRYASQPVPYKPARTGYEKYSQEPVAELQVDAALWGVAPKKQPTPAAAPAPASAPAQASSSTPAPAGRKMMSLEEVEAQMRAQPKKPAQQATPSPAPQPQIQPQIPHDNGYQFAQPAQPQAAGQADHLRPKEQSFHPGHGHPVTILQRPQSKHTPPAQPLVQQPVTQPALHQRLPQQPPSSVQPVQPTQILQNPNRLSGDAAKFGLHSHPTPPIPGNFPAHPSHRQQGSFSRQPLANHSAQLSQLTEEEKMAYMDQEAKRAKRNHKIFLMSRDNGIMTPQDKNFVTRIQLQQLVSATGNPNEHGTDESLAEDFYYQVHNQIQGGQRQHPSQPLSNFAQTYLYQTGSRQGGLRRHNRGPENHMQRMEQQVQRAVEAAKNKPKNKQLVIEGSLGKISFSNAKTPKPLLNIKRHDSSSEAHRPSSSHRNAHAFHGTDKKGELHSIETIYSTLMKMEDHDRLMPPPPSDDADTEGIQRFVAWSNDAQALNKKLWKALRVHDHSGPDNIHPFIALLSYAKGKKAMQRIFRHSTQEQRTTILTLIVVNLDNLDVVRNAQVTTGEMQLNSAMRENVELFSVAVMSTLFTFMNELDLDLVAGVLGLVCTRNVGLIARSKIGVSMLTMILSRAEIIKHGGGGSEQSWRAWDATYSQFFDLIEPSLPHIFPGTVHSGEDVYVWQLLAAIGIGAGPDQQQRLVLAVKDRVMDTVSLSKTLPQDLASQRLQNVNLFMRSIGLDVELLQ
ncbi:topoisomerase II-associated protein PAT1 [Lasiosphaeria miniovina]|uniref:Topoisomerase II-associated protein PAT1 n=1 Tax=Lasiosphaeria miniovina TaxID=1954250 RepID=A0AA40E2F9_9PEZI|nr:topoisomerase II-associated protein PAT1 [Lasiosphaeria miniovina]KAK0721731.1 topoisomerase II-associated protein PAT1 [Lasiosphaeria miniovina]